MMIEYFGSRHGGFPLNPLRSRHAHSASQQTQHSLTVSDADRASEFGTQTAPPFINDTSLYFISAVTTVVSCRAISAS